MDGLSALAKDVGKSVIALAITLAILYGALRLGEKAPNPIGSVTSRIAKFVTPGGV